MEKEVMHIPPMNLFGSGMFFRYLWVRCSHMITTGWKTCCGINACLNTVEEKGQLVLKIH